MRRFVAATTASLSTLPVVVLCAPPAFAASFSTTITCAGGALAASGNNFSTTSGDTIVVLNSTSVGLARTAISGASGPGSVSAAGPFSTGTFTVSGTSGGSFTLQQDPSGACANQSITISFTGGGGGGGGGGGAESSSAPAPIVQQFGMPASGTCDAAASAELNWAGVASGGWSISWAEWMNGGRGGVVCTRTLSYDTRTAAWAVAA